MSQDVCCPEFNPAPWNETVHTWDKKPFITASVPQFFHMPLPGVYGKTITKLRDDAKKLGIAQEDSESILLSFDPTPWKSELYLSVAGEKEGVSTVNFSGKYISKVFDGPYSDAPKYIAELEECAHEKRKHLGKIYFYYTTCPKCAKKYGHNYIVAFGEITEEF